MSDPRADVALLIDFTDLCQSLAPEGEGRDSQAHPGPGEAAVLSPADAARIASALQRYSAQVGRLALARAYADWSRCAPLAREVSNAQLEPILVPATVEGEDRSHIRLVADALEALYAGDEPDAFILVTGDPTLLPLVQKLKADGSEVVVVAPEGTAGEELRSAADRFVPLESILAGEEGEPARPRTWRGGRGAANGEAKGRAPRAAAAEPRREPRPPHPTPVASDQDFTGYDWGPFVRLIDELEHRLPFVGVRYLVNKVLGAHNSGIDDPRLKRDLINRAVDEGLIEMYPVGNVRDRSDPVTACRLERKNAVVVGILGETDPPVAPPEHAHDAEDPELLEAANDAGDV